MFNNKKRPTSSTVNNNTRKEKENVLSVNMVSEGTQIIGTLNTKCDIRIAGKVDGEAKVDGKIIVASTGHIEGNLNSTDADIAGRIEGEVHASSKLTLRQSAVIDGDLYAQSLVVEEGATFNGGCHMLNYSKNGKASENQKSAEKTVPSGKENEAIAV